jgi:hypothetical protein
MLEFTEIDALERVHEIGTAFDNDYNDGDGPDFECVTIQNVNNRPVLEYSYTFVSEDEETTGIFRWELRRVNLGED